jgi:hypothetical protein
MRIGEKLESVRNSFYTYDIPGTGRPGRGRIVISLRFQVKPLVTS